MARAGPGVVQEHAVVEQLEVILLTDNITKEVFTPALREIAVQEEHITLLLLMTRQRDTRGRIPIHQQERRIAAERLTLAQQPIAAAILLLAEILAEARQAATQAAIPEEQEW